MSGPMSCLLNAAGVAPVLEHKLGVRLHGVAPSGIDVGNFLARLAGVNCFSNINPSYSRDRIIGGKIMREFEVAFTINLGGDFSPQDLNRKAAPAEAAAAHPEGYAHAGP